MSAAPDTHMAKCLEGSDIALESAPGMWMSLYVPLSGLMAGRMAFGKPPLRNPWNFLELPGMQAVALEHFRTSWKNLERPAFSAHRGAAVYR
jgi:hypothetical protein